ncbi:MAG TPA: hypothetical protein VM943_01830, partial [Pyrinomonadaceae bacterium]|nr:hypothetical protein [Pyrinomonadaceae bacterium]
HAPLSSTPPLPGENVRRAADDLEDSPDAPSWVTAAFVSHTASEQQLAVGAEALRVAPTLWFHRIVYDMGVPPN